MSVPTSEVGYTSATTGRGDHKVHKGHVVALEEEEEEEEEEEKAGGHLPAISAVCLFTFQIWTF
jgi:hypothetical protein